MCSIPCPGCGVGISLTIWDWALRVSWYYNQITASLYRSYYFCVDDLESKQLPPTWHTTLHTRCSNIGSMLVHCLRRWPNIKPKLGQRFVFAGEFDGAHRGLVRLGIPSNTTPSVHSMCVCWKNAQLIHHHLLHWPAPRDRYLTATWVSYQLIYRPLGYLNQLIHVAKTLRWKLLLLTKMQLIN